MEIQYTCIGALEDGKTRCRRTAKSGSRFCDQQGHKEGARIAPPPNVILIEPKINPFWFGQLAEEISLRLVRSEETKKEEQRQQHIAQAERLNRQPFTLIPPKEASGTQVFGKRGVEFVNISGLLQEFLEEGYLLTEIHAEPAANPPMMVLTMNFSRQIEFVDSSLFELMKSDLGKAILGLILGSVWQYCHIWVNPPDERGRVVHTVNLAHRHELETPSRKLKLAQGLWELE